MGSGIADVVPHPHSTRTRTADMSARCIAINASLPASWDDRDIEGKPTPPASARADWKITRH
jgi:hypothetical protein